MATRCPRCGKWLDDGQDECSICGFSLGSNRDYGKSNVDGNPL